MWIWSIVCPLLLVLLIILIVKLLKKCVRRDNGDSLRSLTFFVRLAIASDRMRASITGIALLLLTLWIPATSLCLAENAGLVVDSDHCGDCPSSQASPCCALASAAYKLDDNGSVVVPWLGNSVSLFRDAVDVHPPLLICLARNGCESPPEVRSSWQFCIRAAANPRAPSSAS
jgi:hypothetical protein